MPVSTSVIGSRAEARNFRKLDQRWGTQYRLYHNLPFLNVFDVADGEVLIDWSHPALEGQLRSTFQIHPADRNRLKKTSVDYVLCDRQDAPLVAIEFDGLAGGVNLGTTYRATNEWTSDSGTMAWRRQITQLKLRIAHGLYFPYFVVGSRHFDDITPGVKLTIVDAVIGRVLAGRARRERFDHGLDVAEFGFTQDEFDQLSAEEQSFYFDDWAIGVEVEADYTHNPLYDELTRLREATGYCGHRSRPLGQASLTSPYIGAEAIFTTTDHGVVRGEAWLPNFNTPYFTPYGLVGDIAELIALTKLSHVTVKDADQ